MNREVTDVTMDGLNLCQQCDNPLMGQEVGGLCAKCLLKLALAPPAPAEPGEVLPRAATEPARVRYFGDYELVEEIARGGMGVVYRARQVSLNRIVALKMILAGDFSSPAMVERFQTEAEAAARLEHPNIVPIHEVGTHEGQHYFSMRFVEGGSLLQAMTRGRFSPRRATELMVKVARAVHHAHQRGILHRDLKPGNILLDAAGEPHVVDFGLAKLLEHDSALTQSVAVMGTPGYMAPEQAAGQTRQATTAVDIYSLGAVLYELLTGRAPFRGPTPAEVMRQVMEVEPARPRLINLAVDRDLETVCLKCLEKDPRRRYGSVEAFAEDLERWLSHEPVYARRATFAGRTLKWVRRKPVVAALLGGVLLVGAAGLGGILWQWRRAEVHAAAEAAERRRAQSAVTRLEIEKAESLFAADDSSRGLSYLARLLRQQPTNRVVAERLLSALSHRNFCLPAAPSLAHDAPVQPTASPPTALDRLQRVAQLHTPIRIAEFSPDGRRVLTAGEDGSARLWDGRTGLALCAPLRHEAGIVSARFSPDGQRVVTASLDHTARIWDSRSGLPILPPLPHKGMVLFAAFNATGTKVVTGSQDRTLRIWDAQTGEPLTRPMPTKAPPFYVNFSPDGNRLLIGANDAKARLLDSSTGLELAVWSHDAEHADHAIAGPQFSPGAERVLTMDAFNGIVQSVNAQGNSVARQYPHNGEMAAVQYSPDGGLVATASHDNTARIWDAHSGSALTPPLRHDHWVNFVHFSDDRQRLVTSSKDRSARIWDVSTGRVLTESLRHDLEVFAAQFSPSGQSLLTITAGTRAWLWDIRHAQPLALLLPHGSPVRHVAFSPDGRSMASVTTGGTVHVWDSRSGQPLIEPLTHSGYLWRVRFSPDGTRLLTASLRGTAQVWDAATGKPVAGPLIHRAGVYDAQFSPDGRRVVTASADKTARVWDAGNGEPLTEIKHSAHVNAAAFSPEGRRVVTASYDKTARIHDASTGKPLTEPLLHDDWVYGAAFSSDGHRVATASKDKTARIWDALTGEMLTPPLAHSDELSQRNPVQFSSDGLRVATSAGNAAHIWHARTGQPVTPPLKHPRRVNSARLSPDGGRLVTACYDGRVRIFDVVTGHVLSEPLGHGASATYAEFSSDGGYVATACSDDAARVWEVPLAPLPIPEWLPELGEAVAGQRIDAEDTNSMVSVEKLFELKQRLSGETRERHAPEQPEQREASRIPETVSAGMPTAGEVTRSSDYYAAWAKWFFADSSTRTLSPSSPVSVPEYVERLMKENRVESAREALLLSSSNARTWGRLAELLIAAGANVEPTALVEADWLSRRAVQLAPANDAIQAVRARVLQRMAEPLK